MLYIKLTSLQNRSRSQDQSSLWFITDWIFFKDKISYGITDIFQT